MKKLLQKLNQVEYTELTFEELKLLEQHERVVSIDFTGFIGEDMELNYEIQVTREGTTKESDNWNVTTYPVYVRAYKGF